MTISIRSAENRCRNHTLFFDMAPREVEKKGGRRGGGNGEAVLMTIFFWVVGGWLGWDGVMRPEYANILF